MKSVRYQNRQSPGCSTAVLTDLPGPVTSAKAWWLLCVHGRNWVHLEERDVTLLRPASPLCVQRALAPGDPPVLAAVRLRLLLLAAERRKLPSNPVSARAAHTLRSSVRLRRHGPSSSLLFA